MSDETLPGAPPDPDAAPPSGGEPCPDCGGTGKVGDEWCTSCNGSGRLT